MSTGGGVEAETVDVTVLIPAFNRAHLLPRAIESARAQISKRAAHVVVVDDGSTDDSVAVAESLGAEVIRHERNRGVSAARNTGLAAATTEWVALLDSDDAWLPDHISNMWASRHGHVVVASCAVWVESDGTAALKGTAGPSPIVVESPTRLLFPENYVPASSTMLHRETALAVGGYDESLSRAEDLDILIRLIESGTCLVRPEVGVVYYGHGAQLTVNRSTMRDAHREVIESYRDRDWWTPRLLALWDGGDRWDKARAAERAGRRQEAARILAGALAHPVEIEGIARMLTWRRRVRRRLPDVMPSVEPVLGR